MDFHDERTRARRIAELNDKLRKTGSGGRTVVTRAVAALPADIMVRLLAAVREFDAFDKNNDPYGERDMAFINLDTEIFAWKIDYFDSDLICGSPEPADETVTCRVLTILSAGEL